MTNRITAEEVIKLLNHPDVIICDCRFSLKDPSAGRKAYEEGHIKGAVYIDLEKHLSSPVQHHGGRHPLPDVNILSQFLGSCGINYEKKVIAYDGESGVYAARLWWILRYLGHTNVYILQGGYSHYKEKGGPVSSNLPQLKPVNFIPVVQRQLLASREEVVHGINPNNQNEVLLDVREPIRYRGEFEPIDAIGGHIPQSVNFPWEENFQSPGFWKTKSELMERHEWLKEKEITVYCGSGVTACAALFAMNEAGLTKAKLYAGSWSDWITYRDAKIEKGLGSHQ